MKFDKPLTDIIRKRSSIRTYRKDLIEEEVKSNLKDSFNYVRKSPVGDICKFHLINLSEVRDKKVKIGTYGIIKNAPSFIVGIVKPGDYAYENLGYQLEQIILKATELELGTCWIGGTFKKKDFANILKLDEDEIIPAISPVGYPARKKSLTDTLTRTLARSAKRKSFEELFYDGEFGQPLPKNESNPYSEVLEMVRLAPSAGNTQPWRIVRDGRSNTFHLFKTFTNALYENSGLNLIDMGIAMCHFELTARYKDLDGEWKCEDPHLLHIPDKTDYVISWFGE